MAIVGPASTTNRPIEDQIARPLGKSNPPAWLRAQVAARAAGSGSAMERFVFDFPSLPSTGAPPTTGLSNVELFQIEMPPCLTVYTARLSPFYMPASGLDPSLHLRHWPYWKMAILCKPKLMRMHVRLSLSLLPALAPAVGSRGWVWIAPQTLATEI